MATFPRVWVGGFLLFSVLWMFFIVSDVCKLLLIIDQEKNLAKEDRFRDLGIFALKESRGL